MIRTSNFLFKRGLNAVKLTELEPRSSNNERILEGHNLNTVLDVEAHVFSSTPVLNIFTHTLFGLEKNHPIFFMFCKLQHNAIRLKTRLKRTSNKVGNLRTNQAFFIRIFHLLPSKHFSKNPILSFFLRGVFTFLIFQEVINTCKD